MSTAPDDPELSPLAQARLRAALRRLDGEPPAVPTARDDALRRSLAAAIESRRPWGVMRRRWIRTAAAAAVLLIGFLALTQRTQDRPVRELDRASMVAAGDLDLDGRISILDAFSLARSLRDRVPTDARADVTGDGVVDERDIEALTERAVALTGGPR